MTVILDYGLGNLRSVQKACEHLGAQAHIQSSLEGASRLILPGVGAFGTAMQRLAPFASEVRKFAISGRPIMGICLGQQLLFESSEEYGSHEGLGILEGKVKYLPERTGLKLPQIGWNSLQPGNDDVLLNGVAAGSNVYFVHSLYTDCADPSVVAAWTEYGIRYASAVRNGNVWGAQFHPEKSGAVGLRILKNFLEFDS
ncbi:imidazole glycerol phosphate synthase subunit HisH [Kamptonema cortianum]|nr:imidazole glycerol phosphate synthase subunit HisH [Geitlerinema splendidum]MDK3157641.1 imidazole glycerol phosphate synthase subunit HisH [Kamptonema cortianum]